jgi:hypothetical protein
MKQVVIKSNCVYRFDDAIDHDLCNKIQEYVLNKIPNTGGNHNLPWMNGDSLPLELYDNKELKKSIIEYRQTLTHIASECFNEKVY